MAGVCSAGAASLVRIYADNRAQNNSDDDSGCSLEEYVWVPEGVQPDMIHMYFSSLPDNRIPYANSPGEKWRNEQLIYQNPPQDSHAKYCGYLSLSEERELQSFVERREDECLGRGIVAFVPNINSSPLKCHFCKGNFKKNEIAIKATNFDKNIFWHPKCFQCNHCEELLVDLVYYKYEQNIYCGRHHAELFKPRCSKCDELIFSYECTEAEGYVWHMKHFICVSCDCQLGGQKYLMKDEQPFCIPCYNNSYNLITCNTCQKEIISDKPHITQSTFHWHADERCFCCSVCDKNLLGKRYTFVNSQLFCEREACRRMERAMSQQSSSSVPSLLSNGHSGGTKSKNSNESSPNLQNHNLTFDSQASTVSIKSSKSLPSSKLKQVVVKTEEENNGTDGGGENIYETLLPCSSSNSSSRGSLIYPSSVTYCNYYVSEKNYPPQPPISSHPTKQGVRFMEDTKSHPKNTKQPNVVKVSNKKYDHPKVVGEENHYDNDPTLDYCSSSDSDPDDEYLTNYLAVSMDTCKISPKGHPKFNITQHPYNNPFIKMEMYDKQKVLTKQISKSSYNVPTNVIKPKKAKKKNSGRSCIVS
uniref:Prickle-like protein 2 n=1 Tax=Strongyloides papillosus TaxID=174720 RepID=A0A0N5BH60_STREA